MELHYKVECWRKMYLPDFLSPEEVVEIVTRNHESANGIFIDIEAVNFDPCDQMIDETEEQLSIEENNNQSTIEIVDDDGKVIWNNLTLYEKEAKV